jgi:ribosomal protein S18 acetylase RimI-like enzyme
MKDLNGWSATDKPSHRIVGIRTFLQGRPFIKKMNISEVTEATDELVAAMERLLSQLMASPRRLAAADVEGIVASPGVVLFVARDAGEERAIVGMLALVLYRIPSGLKAWIEDVVVDERHRRLGVGAALVRAALERAKIAGASLVDLTSRPSRTGAIQLYLRLGFEQRETDIYRCRL